MTKEESLMLKGVAILFMLFYHLFNQTEEVSNLHHLILINGKPFVEILVQATHPVSFFLILGGYGMFKVFQKGDKNRWSRIIRLMVHYWIILAIFLTIGHFMKPNIYPGALYDIISNFTAFNTSYNGEMWFLFPYIVLTLLSPVLFRITRHIQWWLIIISLFICFIATSFTISRFGSSFLYHNMWIYNPLLVFHLMFQFFLGAVAAREDFFIKVKKVAANHNWVRNFVSGGVILCVFISCVFKYFYIYPFLLITLILIAHVPRFVQYILVLLGRQSMGMWMIHTWFCYYLFRREIYSLAYPLLIFVVLVLISFIVAIIVDKICRQLMDHIQFKSRITKYIRLMP